LFERWQDEQRNWQKLVMQYVDKASTDEAFLTNLGNAMRGSLMANKPYPGTAVGSDKVAGEVERAALDEVVFAIRKVEGQLLDVTMSLERLVTRLDARDAQERGEPYDPGSHEVPSPGGA
jgi:hypothetical protein